MAETAKTIALIKAIAGSGGGGGGGAVDDVQINGTSIVQDGVADVLVADGLQIKNGSIMTNKAQQQHVKSGTENYRPIVADNQHMSVFYGLSKLAGEDLKNDTVTLGTYPEKSKSAISQMLDAPETISGTTPSITAKPGVRYICGECSTLTIVVPSSGIIDVTFESGSTPTVLTVTPPTGVMAIKWANGFDPTSLEANTTYEINIMDGEFGVVGEWT